MDIPAFEYKIIVYLETVKIIYLNTYLYYLFSAEF